MKNIIVLLIVSSIILLLSCEKEKEHKSVLKTSYYNYNDFVSEGLVAYYPFNGNTNDTSGNQLNGIAKNVSYSSDRFNNLNRACLFNGIDSYVEIENSALLNGNTYTVCFWYKAELNDTLNQSIISKSDASTIGNTIGLYNSHNFSYLGFAYMDKLLSSGGGISFGPSFKEWSLNGVRKFEFAAISFSEAEIIDYFGGKEFSYKPSLFFNSNTNKLYIGKSDNGKYKNYTGEVDDLLIYNRILTYEEVEKLYKWNAE